MSEITIEKVTELFNNLKEAPPDDRFMKKWEIERYLWSSTSSEEGKRDNFKKFVEVGGINVVQQFLESEDLANIESIICLLNSAFDEVIYSDDLAIGFVANDVCVERLLKLCGKFGDQPLPSTSYVKINSVAIKVALAITARRENRDILIEKLMPGLLSELLSDEVSPLQNEAFICVVHLIGDSDNPEHEALIKSKESLVKNIVYAITNIATCDSAAYFKLKDLVNFLKNLASHECHRKTLFKFNVVTEMVKALKQDENIKKPIILNNSIDICTLLAFDKPMASAFKNEDVITIIKNLKQIAASDPDTSQKLDKLTWMLLSKHNVGNCATGKLRVLLSFSCTQRDFAESLKTRLSQLGCDFDFLLKGEHAQGHTLDSTLKAVDDADVAVLCVSDVYKRCVNCRIEAEYVSATKPFVLATVQPDYNPTGWLASLAPSVITITGSFDENDATQRLADAIKQAADADWSNPKSWDARKVGRWLTKQGFSEVAPAFAAEEVNGAALHALARADMDYFESRVISYGLRKTSKILQLRSILLEMYYC